MEDGDTGSSAICSASPQCQFLSSKSTWFKILDPRAHRESCLHQIQGLGPALWEVPCAARSLLFLSPSGVSLLPLHTRPTAALTAGWAAPQTPNAQGTPLPQKHTGSYKAAQLARLPHACAPLGAASWGRWPSGHVPLSFITQKCQMSPLEAHPCPQSQRKSQVQTK